MWMTLNHIISMKDKAFLNGLPFLFPEEDQDILVDDHPHILLDLVDE